MKIFSLTCVACHAIYKRREISFTQMVGCQQEDKDLSGSGRSQWTHGLPLSTMTSPTLKVKRNVDLKLDTSIGRSSSTSRRRDRLQLLKESSPLSRAMSLQDLPQQKPTSGRKIPELETLSSNLEKSPSCGLERPTGMLSGDQLEAETSWLSLPMFEVLNFDQCNVILTSEEFAQILPSLSQWNVRFTYFGEIPVLENPEGLGMRRVSALILKVPLQSSGMVTKVILIN